MARKKPEGIEALIDKPDPCSIQDIRMFDWYAAFALFSLPVNMGAKRRAAEAFEIAAEMMKEREKHL